MKCLLPLLTASFLLSAAAAIADEGQTVTTIVTKSGKTYQNCRIFKQDPDGVMFAHQHGAAKILYADMSSSMRDALGYDAEKAATYAKSLSERYAKERAREFEYRNLVMKAQIAQIEARAAEGRGEGYPVQQEGVWNSGTLDYTTIAPWGYAGYGGGYYGSRNSQHHRGAEVRSTEQRNGPLCPGVQGKSIVIPSRASHVRSGSSSGNYLGVPPLTNFVAPPLAVRPIPAAGR